jgi:hypothetical protein
LLLLLTRVLHAALLHQLQAVQQVSFSWQFACLLQYAFVPQVNRVVCPVPSVSPGRVLGLTTCHAVNPEKNGSYDGMPIVSGPISVGASSMTADMKDKGSKPVDRSKGLWTRCDKCGVILYIKHLKEHHHICFGCNYHLKMTSQERVDHLIDPGAMKMTHDRHHQHHHVRQLQGTAPMKSDCQVPAHLLPRAYISIEAVKACC